MQSELHERSIGGGGAGGDQLAMDTWYTGCFGQVMPRCRPALALRCGGSLTRNRWGMTDAREQVPALAGGGRRWAGDGGRERDGGGGGYCRSKGRLEVITF